MGLIPEDVIQEVLTRSDILEIVRQYVSLKRAGQNYKGLCPFHQENTPSFNVHPGKGIFKCFGCGQGGDVIRFLMEIEGWAFPEAVRQLAARYGVDIPESSPEEEERQRERREARQAYFAIMEEARAFFEERLWDEAGERARDYLEGRSIDEETARTFGLGYAPDDWSALLDHLREEGHAPRALERAGLVLERRGGGGYYDRFRDRVVFPIVDVWNHTLAFGGRRLSDDRETPKYINSPETRFYRKGKQLFGLHAAKQAIQRIEVAVLVEGNFDVIALYAMGFEHVVAPMGTALTEAQVGLLKRYARRVVVAFDGDEAGEEATLRALPALEAAEIDARVVRFGRGPDGDADDPDSFVRREGVARLEDKVDSAEPVMAWALGQIFDRVDGAPIEEQLDALREAAELLERVTDPIAWNHYASEVARRLPVDAKLLQRYLKKPRAHNDEARRALRRAQQEIELDSAELGTLVVLVAHPEWLETFFEEELANLLGSQELASFLEDCAEYYAERGKLDVAVLLEGVAHPAFRETLSTALTRDEAFYYNTEKPMQFYKDCVRTLKRQWADRTLRELTDALDHTDLMEERERYRELVDQKKQVEEFKTALEIS